MIICNLTGTSVKTFSKIELADVLQLCKPSIFEYLCTGPRAGGRERGISSSGDEHNIDVCKVGLSSYPYYRKETEIKLKM
jgi:hypothetical protein